LGEASERQATDRAQDVKGGVVSSEETLARAKEREQNATEREVNTKEIETLVDQIGKESTRWHTREARVRERQVAAGQAVECERKEEEEEKKKEEEQDNCELRVLYVPAHPTRTTHSHSSQIHPPQQVSPPDTFARPERLSVALPAARFPAPPASETPPPPPPPTPHTPQQKQKTNTTK